MKALRRRLRGGISHEFLTVDRLKKRMVFGKGYSSLDREWEKRERESSTRPSPCPSKVSVFGHLTGGPKIIEKITYIKAMGQGGPPGYK